jgi:hypothetical protein
MREFAITLVLVSAALFAWVLGSEADEIAFRDLAVFTVALAIILTVQVLLLFVLNRRVEALAPRKKELALLIGGALILASNAYFLAFYTLEQPTAYRVACAVVVGVAFFVLMSFPSARPVLRIFAGIMLVMSLAQYGYARATLLAAAAPEGTESLPVNSKRNVYIIGMESLQSPAAYRDNYGIADAVYVKALRDLGFRVLDRAYSAERSTLRTWATVFEFKRCVRQCPGGGSDLGAREVFVRDNSTFRSFRDSHYKIQFLYKNHSQFSVDPKKVNYYYPGPGFDACDELGRAYFYGLCSKPIVKAINERVFGDKKLGWKDQITLLEKRADFAVSSKEPWLTWTHIKFPQHTAGSYQYPDPSYYEEFKRWTRDAMPTIADNMQKTAGYIVARDPNAVVVVMGDHGTHLFRREDDMLRQELAAGTSPIPLETILETEHGVTLAIYPADFCANRLGERVSTRFLFENIIACLNGNDSPTDEERKRAGLIRFLGELRTVDEIQAKTLAQPQEPSDVLAR